MTRRTPAQYDWDGQEFDERLLTKHMTAPRRDKVRFIVAHHMTVKGSTNGAANDKCYSIWQTRQASAHYAVDGDYLMQFVWDSNAAWATAKTYGNHAGISIEHANSTLSPSWQISEKTWRNGAKLVAYLHRTHKLGRPTSTGFGTGGTLRTHQSFYATSCPGPWFKANWAKYVAEAQRVYDEITGTPPPVPQPKVIVTSAIQNMGSYNAHGASTFKARTDRYVAARLKTLVDVINLQEVGNGLGTKKKPNCRMRPRLDAGLKAKYVRRTGTDGRYCYTGNGVTYATSGTFTAKSGTWFNRDNKQASWVAYWIGGLLGMDVSVHLESDLGPVPDAKRVAQMHDFAAQALAKATALGINHNNVMLCGDTNSNSMVLDSMTPTWRNLAAGTPFEKKPTFIGWNGLMKDRFDYALVLATAKPGKVVAVSADTNISDHAGLRVERELTR